MQHSMTLEALRLLVWIPVDLIASAGSRYPQRWCQAKFRS